MRFKYLKYVPSLKQLKPEMYDLVDDEEFCKPNGRIPLLIVIQDGIFPSRNSYGERRKDYSQLKGLENQNVGFVRRTYLSNIEYEGIVIIFLDTETIRTIRTKGINAVYLKRKNIILN